MSCEYSKECGFLRYLVSNGVPETDDCGKTAKNECPRLMEANGEEITDKMKKVLRLEPNQSVLGYKLPFTYEEICICSEEKVI